MAASASSPASARPSASSLPYRQNSGGDIMTSILAGVGPWCETARTGGPLPGPLRGGAACKVGGHLLGLAERRAGRLLLFRQRRGRLRGAGRTRARADD